ncbi:amidohydrolase family protein [Pantoea sp. FN060301]|uniref:amidohydrolase family protein n=1 Tax=Pantoea sp. FN060301 TaxID=3420380 RepID=UPI003D1768E4
MTLKIDAHHHLWRYSPDEYRWISDEMPALKHDFLPVQLMGPLAAAQIDGTVLVQARQTAEETAWLLGQAKECEQVRAVVGWVALTARDLPQQLEAYQQEPLLRGFRHLIQDEADPDGWMRQDKVNAGLQRVQQQNYVYDLLVTHRHLAEAARFAARHDRASIVLDHLGKPDLAAGAKAWAAQIAPLAALPHVSCKISGLLTEPRPPGCEADDLLPFYDAALTAFGSERLLVGSDWPVCLLAGSYEAAWQSGEQAFAALSASEQAAILGGNACRIYGINGVTA